MTGHHNALNPQGTQLPKWIASELTVRGPALNGLECFREGGPATSGIEVPFVTILD